MEGLFDIPFGNADETCVEIQDLNLLSSVKTFFLFHFLGTPEEFFFLNQSSLRTFLLSLHDTKVREQK